MNFTVLFTVLALNAPDVKSLSLSTDPCYIQPCSLWISMEEVWWDLCYPGYVIAASFPFPHQRLILGELLWPEACRSRRHSCCPSRAPAQTALALLAPPGPPSLPAHQTGQSPGSTERRRRFLDPLAAVLHAEVVQGFFSCVPLCVHGLGWLGLLPTAFVCFLQNTDTFSASVAGRG